MEIIFWTHPEIVEAQIISFARDGISISKSFLVNGNRELGLNFLKVTGLRSLNKCGLSGSYMHSINYGAISSFSTALGINHHTQYVRVCWRSHSGKIYHLHDEVDCSDIQFWLEGVDVSLVYQQLYGPTTLPFKLQPTRYQLIIGAMAINMEIEIVLHAGFGQPDTEKMAQAVDAFIAMFNAQSEKKNRKDGVVHNWRYRSNNNILWVEMDMGSTGAAFLKKLLKWLNGFDTVGKVVIGNTADG